MSADTERDWFDICHSQPSNIVSIHSTSQYSYAKKVVLARHNNTHPRTDSCNKYVHCALIIIRNEVTIIAVSRRDPNRATW